MAEVVISESSIARLAGNIASGLVTLLNSTYLGKHADNTETFDVIAKQSVKLARMIVDELKRTA